MRILIVNNNLAVGGIQKSLINLLHEISKESNITIDLLLFWKQKGDENKIPKNVRILQTNKIYSLITKPKNKLRIIEKAMKVFFIFLAKCFSNHLCLSILGLFQKPIEGYDVAISFSQAGSDKYFTGGCPNFVLNKVKAQKKYCFIHCDYKNSATQSHYNDYMYSQFDKIACCSEAVKKIFDECNPNLVNKTVVVRNFYDLSVKTLANIDPFLYDNAYINLISVARLSPEKGIERAVSSVIKSRRKDIRYYIVGDGPLHDKILMLIQKNNMEDQIILLGETNNPYRFMKNADYLIIPSFHEAAPMVIDEANMLGLRIISTRTISSIEMIPSSGFICDNSEDGILKTISSISKPLNKNENSDLELNNKTRVEKFVKLIEEK